MPRENENESGKNLLELYLGYKCNARCVFCFNPASQEDMPLKRAAEVLRRARLNGYERLDLMGGEPTVSGDVVLVCALAKKFGFKSIGLYSNGIRLADSRLATGLRAAGLDIVYMGVHGHTPELHDAATRVPGSFEKVLRAIANLQRCGVRVKLVHVVNRMNYRSLPEYCEYFVGTAGVTQIRIIRLVYVEKGRFQRAERGDLRRLLVPMSESAPYVTRSFAAFQKRGLPLPTLNHFVPCLFPNRERESLELLDSPLEEQCAENFLTYYPDSSTIQNSAALVGVKAEKCGACAFFKNCPGVEESYLRFYGDGELAPCRNA